MIDRISKNAAMTVPYKIIRSDRKTIAIQIMPDGQILVRCPRRMGMEDVQGFVQSKATWIEKQLAKRPRQTAEQLTAEEIRHLREQARKVITERVTHFAPIVGVSYNRIAIRTQHTRWGSCSSKGNLNFNCLLAMVPEDVRDYIVVHELCHLKELNHSPAFWAEVERILPNYRHSEKWLKENGQSLIARIAHAHSAR